MFIVWSVALPLILGMWIAALIFGWHGAAETFMSFIGSMWSFFTAHVLRSWS